MLTQDGNLIIHADELTIGDVIRHFNGEMWEVYTEPKYTKQGIIFDALCLNFGETQKVTFHPEWRFELLTHNLVAEEVEA